VNQKVLIYFIGIFVTSCNSEKELGNGLNRNQIGTATVIVETIDTVNQGIFINYPIPELDSIFPFCETSGMVAKCPSPKYYNPYDSGIFVNYSLFYQNKSANTKYLSKKQVGLLFTHTYMKPTYGWSEKDKDQTFILMQLYGSPIKIGNSIKVGCTFDDLQTELGKPVYQIDSSFVFLGKNKVVAHFDLKNGVVESLKYGRFNLTDEIFIIDSVSRKEILEEKLCEIRLKK
jgi:hypothetical protein